MTKEESFSATFKQEKETKNTVRYSEESEDRRPVLRGFCHRKDQDEIKDIHLGLPKSD